MKTTTIAEVKSQYDREAPHFTETEVYNDYAAAVEGVMTPGEFITIGEMKRRVGAMFYKPEWMQDVVKAFEPRGAKPVRYGLKETAKEICAKLGHMREMNKPNCPRCGGKV
jgi:tRNA(Ile2) C34 agmatinyltransferase TiaS